MKMTEKQRTTEDNSKKADLEVRPATEIGQGIYEVRSNGDDSPNGGVLIYTSPRAAAIEG